MTRWRPAGRRSLFGFDGLCEVPLASVMLPKASIQASRALLEWRRSGDPIHPFANITDWMETRLAERFIAPREMGDPPPARPGARGRSQLAAARQIG